MTTSTNAPVDLKTLTDKELCARFKAGEQAAFTAIYERRAPLVRGYIVENLDARYHSYVDDLVQGVFLSLYTSEPEFRGPRTSLRAWLIMHASHDRLDFTRRKTCQKRAKEMPDTLVCESDRVTYTTPHDDLAAKDTTETLRGMIAQLPKIEKRIVKLLLAGKSKLEIARRTGLTSRRFITHYDRAINNLRKLAPAGLKLAVA